ncbi:MAG: beta-glucuronidase [Eubacteriales bacterium]|nr:beta-glucuronidase [Eubacteriales bacterium]
MLYPILTASRTLMDLGGTWAFKLDTGEGFDQRWYERPLSDAMSMPVPASYNDIKEGIDFRDHYGWVFYQRSIAVPAFLLSQRLVLRLAAVTHQAIVYLNGQEIMRHKGGFLPFEVELNAHIQRGDNLLTIAVDNKIDYSTLPVGSESGSGLLGMFDAMMGPLPEGKPRNAPNFDFFNYCGITRPVKIYSTPKNHISDITVVASVEGTYAKLSYVIDTVGEGDVSVTVRTEDGSEIATCVGAHGDLIIDPVRLWEPLDAYLYQIEVTFGADVYTLPYGVRTVEVRGTQFLINNKPFYFKGFGKHEDTFPAGRGINEPMNAKDISLMRWIGANSFRTSHYPYSEEMMRLCDREGIVVIDEVPAVGLNLAFGGGANFKDGKPVTTFGTLRTAEHHREVIRDMIARDKNHACVVMWSIANEPDSFGEEPYEYFKPLFDLAHELDPQNRPCTLVSVQSAKYQTDCTILLSDVICLNRYYGWYAACGRFDVAQRALENEMAFWATTGKPVMFTEYGADTVAGLHDTTPTVFSEEFQVEYYKANHAAVDPLEFFIGEQVWNFADFATSESIMRVQGNKKGIFTRERRPKLVAHYLRNRWQNIPDYGFKS